MELTVVPIVKPDDANFIFGQSHFIKIPRLSHGTSGWYPAASAKHQVPGAPTQQNDSVAPRKGAEHEER